MTFELDELNTGLISEWMKKVEEIFQKLKEEKLPKNRREYDHVIELTQEIIFSSPLILTRFEEQEIIKTYLNDMLRKR